MSLASLLTAVLVASAMGKVEHEKLTEVSADTRIAINTASDEELRRLPGIGQKRASLIIEERSKRPFRKPQDLKRVKGFGPKTIKRLTPLIRFD